MNRRTKKTRAGIDRIIDSSSRLDAESRKCLKLDFAIPVDTGVVFIYIYILALPIRCNYVRRVAASSIVRFHRSFKVAREGALPEKKIRGVYDFKTRRNFLQIPRGSKKRKRLAFL